jgi:hypothetical protein
LGVEDDVAVDLVLGALRDFLFAFEEYLRHHFEELKKLCS